jgi:lipopolysaccharide export system permease protein
MNSAKNHQALDSFGRRAPLEKTRSVPPRRKRSPLKIADSYLLRHIVEATTRSLVWFAGLLIMVTVVSATRRVADSSLDFFGLLRILASELPRVFVFTIPMSVLYGTVQTFADLSSRGEATALQVGGMSLGRMMRAPLVFGAFMALCVLFLQEKLVPSTQQNKQSVLAQALISGAKPIAPFRYENPPKGTLESVIQAERFDPVKGLLLRPRIQQFDKSGSVTFQVLAKSASWNEAEGKWTFVDVTTVTLPADARNGDFIKGTLPRLQYQAPSPLSLSRKTKTLRQHVEKGDFELTSIADLIIFRNQFRSEMQTEDAETRKQTLRYINSMTYGIHDKIAMPLVCIFLVLIGAPLAMRPQRASGGFSMGISLVVLLVFYVLWTWAQVVGRDGRVNPVLMGYLPVGITAAVGLFLFWKKNR